MYMKSPPYQQMYTQSPYPHTMYPTHGMQPMMPKKKGFLAKLFQKRNPNPAVDYMYMMPPYRQLETYPNTPYQQSQPYMHPPKQQQQMMQTQMAAEDETRGAGNTPSGISSFFTNFISNPTGMINNVEKVVQMAQSVSPVVQQYGPIVRNIPNIMKILTSGKNADEKQTEEVKTTTAASTATHSEEIPITSKPLVPPITLEDKVEAENVHSSTPKPKLYV
ncbi:VrrA/YqfQ family protein [Bacillus sp. WLY-B-L8]|uniref:VrrA/YqfQ family protein n=1 Tax=Bacillus multifaciens TaxID=3068506 RepID=UPI0027407B41|nr:VrrA/YqfQ family protein [Bacillus sp. WLY-B-L8]MDP7977218.1 VrrA/YqfQ family protein [Bacillus sp. WLY-B-L8]